MTEHDVDADGFKPFKFTATLFEPNVYAPGLRPDGSRSFSIAVEWREVPEELRPYLIKNAGDPETPGVRAYHRNLLAVGSVAFIHSKQRPMILPQDAGDMDNLARLKERCDATNQSPDLLLAGTRATVFLGVRQFRDLYKLPQSQIALRAIVVPVRDLADSMFALATYRTSGGW